MHAPDALRTSNFQDFLQSSSHFAKLAFDTEFDALPHLVKQSKKIIGAVGQEMRKFPKICSKFATLVQSFVDVATNTRHNMNIGRSHLNKVLELMEKKVIKAIKSTSEPLSADDTIDMRLGFVNTSNGAETMLKEANARNCQSEYLQKDIENLMTNIEFKIKSADGRIDFSKKVLIFGAILAGTLLIGAVVLEGMCILPINALITPTVVIMDAVLFLFITLWQKDLQKLQSKLKLVLDYLDKLSLANMSLICHTLKSTEIISFLLRYLSYLGEAIQVHFNQGPRSICAQRCAHAISYTKCLIGHIGLLEHIDLKELVDSNSHNVSS